MPRGVHDGVRGRICPDGCECGRHQRAWNKGLHAATDPRVAILTRKSGDSRKGKLVWNSGLIGAQTMSAKTKVQMSESAKRHCATLTKDQLRTRTQAAVLASRKANPSLIELKVGEVLDNLGIKYLHNQRFSRFYPDFLIEELRLIIECQGCYYHRCPEHGKYGLHENNFGVKKAYYEELRYRAVEIWEHDIVVDNFMVIEQAVGRR